MPCKAKELAHCRRTHLDPKPFETILHFFSKGFGPPPWTWLKKGVSKTSKLPHTYNEQLTKTLLPKGWFSKALCGDQPDGLLQCGAGSEAKHGQQLLLLAHPATRIALPCGTVSQFELPCTLLPFFSAIIWLHDPAPIQGHPTCMRFELTATE